MSLRVPPCCLSGLCYDCISNLLPEMNTQMAAADYQSSPPNPGGWRLCVVPVAVRLYKTSIFLQFITRFPGNKKNKNQCCVFDLHYPSDRFSLSPPFLIFLSCVLSSPDARRVHQFRLDHENKTE